MRILLESFVAALLLIIQTTNAHSFDDIAVSFCCPREQVIKNGECTDMTTAELNELHYSVNVTRHNGSLVKKFLVQQWATSMSCETAKMMYMDNQTKLYGYKLFEDGTLLRLWDNVEMSQWEYCIQPQLVKDGSIRIVPHICKPSKTGQTAVMIVSMTCLVLTISVYLLVRKLRTLVGKCFICYMACLFLAYLFLLFDLWGISKDFCKTAGFLGYFFVLAAFCWLNALSLNLYNKLRGTPSKHRFSVYNIFAWGCAALLTGATFLANRFVKINDLNPRVGEDGNCWINCQDWSGMLYLYGPILLIVELNVFLFIMTVIHIRMKRNVENNRKEDLEPIMGGSVSILRIFTIMGISWIFEVGSYLVQGNKYWEDVFLAADYFNWSQGTIIFVLFVLNGSTLRLLKKSFTGESEIPEKKTKNYQRI
ncbi:G-protein coupled receptor Mth-like [Drosophila biarmipes]|uniref:G-protein coupled receptor Mth-like n=1 Tax=Drosophila biarmipes TaxID=125945 RepID=UPI0021CCE6F8|nr:G-protein coupled receptor Mth-like [Drosophila biarmipes]